MIAIKAPVREIREEQLAYRFFGVPRMTRRKLETHSTGSILSPSIWKVWFCHLGNWLILEFALTPPSARYSIWICAERGTKRMPIGVMRWASEWANGARSRIQDWSFSVEMRRDSAQDGANSGKERSSWSRKGRKNDENKRERWKIKLCEPLNNLYEEKIC